MWGGTSRSTGEGNGGKREAGRGKREKGEGEGGKGKRETGSGKREAATRAGGSAYLTVRPMVRWYVEAMASSMVTVGSTRSPMAAMLAPPVAVRAKRRESFRS